MAAPARSIAGTDYDGPASFNAPLFRSIIDGLDAERRLVVLDLGAACAGTISALSGFRCRLDVADVADGLEDLNEETESAVLREKAEALLPPLRAEAADVVLCWDVLNYLSRPALTTLMERIADRSRAGTLAHMLIVYAATHMPSRPNHYVPLEDLSLLNMQSGPDDREAPRYTPEDLNQCLHGFSVERAMLLSNGMQEFLFRV